MIFFMLKTQHIRPFVSLGRWVRLVSLALVLCLIVAWEIASVICQRCVITNLSHIKLYNCLQQALQAIHNMQSQNDKNDKQKMKN